MSERKSEANNILKSRCVLRWKKGPDGKRVVKARLVVKGFQDRELKSLTVSSPTANKDSQRMINSIAANTGWVLFVLDVSTAFI